MDRHNELYESSDYENEEYEGQQRQKSPEMEQLLKTLNTLNEGRLKDNVEIDSTSWPWKWTIKSTNNGQQSEEDTRLSE